MKVAEAMAKYMELREKEAQLQASYEREIAPIKNAKEKLEQAFLGLLDRAGTDSMAARGVGTVYRATRTSASVADRESFMRFVKAHDEWDLLEVRAAKINCETYLNAHQELPPGINMSRQVTVKFQRAAHQTA